MYDSYVVSGNKLSQWAGEDGGETHLSRAEWPTSSLAATLLFLSRSRLRFAHPAAATSQKKTGSEEDSLQIKGEGNKKKGEKKGERGGKEEKKKEEGGLKKLGALK